MHVSIRVPWHDSRWAGTVCSNPIGNTSCLILPRIAESKNDTFEKGIAGSAWNVEGAGLPACAAERGAFMSPTGYTRRLNHPYAHDPRYKHFRESQFHHVGFSAAPVPFAWVMKDQEDGIPTKAKAYKIDYKPELEPALEFDKLWVQERRNQLALLDTFFGAITPEESLVFLRQAHAAFR